MASRAGDSANQPRLLGVSVENGDDFSLVVHGTISQDQTDEDKNFRLFALTAGDEPSDTESDSSGSDDIQVDLPANDHEGNQNNAPKGNLENDVDSSAVLTSLRDKLASIPGLELSGDGLHSRLIDFLLNSTAKMSAENSMLKKELKALKDAQTQQNDSDAAKPATDIQPTEPDEVYETFHLVLCVNGVFEAQRNYFRDVPRMFKGDRKTDHLRGSMGIENLSKYMETRPHIVFAVVKEYNCSCGTGPDYHRLVGYKDGMLIRDTPPAESTQKSIEIGLSVRSALQDTMKANPERFKGFSIDHIPAVFKEPFLLFYIHNRTFLELVDLSDLEDTNCNKIKMLCNWFEENCREDWKEADELISRKKITAKHYSKLFRPEELVISPRKDRDRLVWVSKTMEYPWKHSNAVDQQSWEFNGSFRKLEFFWPMDALTGELSDRDGEKDVTALSRYPLRFADQGVHEKLIARGHKFWLCRKARLVSYMEREEDVNALKQGEHRFMVDYSIFRRIHPDKDIFRLIRDDLEPGSMANDEPPDDMFLAMMPPEIHGFDLSSKTWRLLQVERITDVTWNKDAFKRLVVPAETKELIEAAVTAHGHQLSAAPDIIGGKGQGLLVLLHGGPGTGKTLTAESIAEAQERPLYRVTCGDIGIEPADVERYLQSVLIIGRAWGCVVLLDEADVFLEERTVQDQKQNAIVSVFLRVLEYYDGIMILTSNRVGTFDEAFKSRIHLAIRYEILDEEQRVEIWRNLIDMLRYTKERVDIQDLEMNVHKLARANMNGRQIRNVITLARYLAKFRKQMLVYRHVQDAVASVGKFDEYLLTLRGSDESWARESRVR